MTKKLVLAFIVTCMTRFLSAQVINTAVMDTTDLRYQGKVTIEGYIDAYYAYDFNNPSSGNRDYFVSMARHNEMMINLAYVDVKYNSSRLRGRFVPGFGSYINANYADEAGSLKNIVEASAGVRVWKDRNIWFDAGVFGSPYTNESAISKDHLAYTRSFAPEYVPYYLSGAKLTIPLNQKWNAYFFLLNGWQQISDVNSGKSLGTQLEYRPNDYLLLNWSTYIGSEKSAKRPDYGMRYFNDFFFIYSRNRLSATGCFYYGIQEHEGGQSNWWQANLIGRYNLSERTSLTGRIEYFDDPQSVQVSPVTNVTGFSSYSSSVGLNFKLAENVLVRLEGRTFFSSKEVYRRGNVPTQNSSMLVSNITIWF